MNCIDDFYYLLVTFIINLYELTKRLDKLNTGTDDNKYFGILFRVSKKLLMILLDLNKPKDYQNVFLPTDDKTKNNLSIRRSSLIFTNDISSIELSKRKEIVDASMTFSEMIFEIEREIRENSLIGNSHICMEENYTAIQTNIEFIKLILISDKTKYNDKELNELREQIEEISYMYIKGEKKDNKKEVIEKLFQICDIKN